MSRIRRRLTVGALVVALAAGAVGVEALVPGPTLRSAPFAGYGIGVAASGPITLTVHDVALASSIVADEEPGETTGVFVVVEVTIAADLSDARLDSELVLAGRTFDPSAKGPTDWQSSTPAEGLPVTGDLVFEVDDALLADGPALAELRVAPSFDASGDLGPQAIAIVQVGGAVEQELSVEGPQR